MDLSRLFKVLVLGGAALAAASCEEEAPPDGVIDAPVAAAADASPPGTPDAAAVPGADSGPAMECLCAPTEAACCESGAPKDGITCCWGTTC